jgi:hypothetical protein
MRNNNLEIRCYYFSQRAQTLEGGRGWIGKLVFGCRSKWVQPELCLAMTLVWGSNAELIITTGSHALSSSGAQKKNRDSVSLLKQL